ncbi:MAG: Ada metal-binding domain-containing protein [Nanoarchaeota archaeon]
MELYKILKDNEIILSERPGEYAGYRPGKIFGTLDCPSGKRKMKKENRVFFHSLEDAIHEGYRPCKICKPLTEEQFETIKHLVPYKTLEDFYNA